MPVEVVFTKELDFVVRLDVLNLSVQIDETFYLYMLQGAPEVIQERLVEVHPKYVEAYKHYTCQGSRVLTLAYKMLPDMPVGPKYVNFFVQDYHCFLHCKLSDLYSFYYY